MSEKKSINWAARYEAAWHECFWQKKEYYQVSVIEEPHGRHATELATDTRRLAENENWTPKKNYQEIPTGVQDLKQLNNEPF